jgi:hypothetical protein
MKINATLLPLALLFLAASCRDTSDGDAARYFPPSAQIRDAYTVSHFTYLSPDNALLRLTMNDTIYNFDQMGRPRPHLIISFGKHALSKNYPRNFPPEKRLDPGIHASDKVFKITSLCENSQFVFFSFNLHNRSHYVLYSKKDGKYALLKGGVTINDLTFERNLPFAFFNKSFNGDYFLVAALPGSFDETILQRHGGADAKNAFRRFSEWEANPMILKVRFSEAFFR